MHDTIFALSSGLPPAGIGVIRISGPCAGDALVALTGRLPKPRKASLATVKDPESGEPLDRALLLWMPGPRTATGENIAEVQCHGGRAVTASILESLGAVPGLRPAVAGEFTRRAFDNGVIDLNEAEGLGDLLLAETQGQRRAALAMAEGHFSRRIEGWRDRLNGLAAMVEAALDFSDEDDVPDAGIGAVVEEGVRALALEVRSELSKASAERLRDGVRVVLAGPPNAGKSTLLNALVGRDAAIVSSTPGTTRDRIEVPVAIGGTAFTFTDTAGLRTSDDAVEIAGVAKARSAMDAADILLWLGAPDQRPLNALCVATQIDRYAPMAGADFAVSALTGEGMSALIDGLLFHSQTIVPQAGDYALHSRQREGISDMALSLDLAATERDQLIVAEHLRDARMALDALTGRAGIEDVLDSLFGRFCIGK